MLEIRGFLGLFCCLVGLSMGPVFGASDPTVAGPWVQLRKSPTFSAPVVAMAPTWGPTIPFGNGFTVEQVYGRWLFGKPAPLQKMKAKDYAPSGWIYTRMVLIEGDRSILSEKQNDQNFYANFYSAEAWRRLGLAPGDNTLAYFSFLESLVLSQKTLILFKTQDEKNISLRNNWDSFLSFAAYAQDKPPEPAPTPAAAPPADGKKKKELVVPEKPEGPPLGLSGIHLGFLEQEAVVVKKQQAQELKMKQAKILKPREIKPIDEQTKILILSRLIAERELNIPALNHEEVDGNLYMRAITKRALDGCPASIRDSWKDRHWFVFRIFGLKEKKDEKNIWYQFAMPGGYFAISNRAIAQAKNEAELAFVLLRPFVRQERLEALTFATDAKEWPMQLRDQADRVWADLQRVQSTKLSKNLDVADEITVDLLTSECIANAGYQSDAGLRYLQRLRNNRDETWAKWFIEHSIGLDYRLQQLGLKLQEEMRLKKIPESETINRKRFETAIEIWNTQG
jgi:hypothetical protein